MRSAAGEALESCKMTNTHFSGGSPRPEAEVFVDLKALCTSPGYIHAIAYFSARDNLIRYSGPQLVVKDLEHQHSHDKLIRTEISTLIGLMVQCPIDLSLPEPKILDGYIEHTETLLQDLHSAMESHWFEGCDFRSGKMPEHDPFATATGMREPIFYGGSRPTISNTETWRA